MEQDKVALRRMDNEFESSKKEQIMSFLRDQSKFNRCLSSSKDDDEADDSHLLSSITNNPRIQLNSLSRPKTASVSRKFQGDIVKESSKQSCKSTILSSSRPTSSYGCRRPLHLQVTREEDEDQKFQFRTRANTTEMSRIDEIDAASNASTRSVTPDLEEIDDSAFVSPLSPQDRNVHPHNPTHQVHPDYIRRRRVKSYSSEPNTRLKPIRDDLKLYKATDGTTFTGNLKKILSSNNTMKSETEIVERTLSATRIDDSVPSSFAKSRSSYGNMRSAGVQSPIIRNNPHGLVAIDPLPIDAHVIGVQEIAMVECDASLYRQMRNKSAPNVRHTEPPGGLRESYKVYHLPPLEKTPSDAINNGDVTSPTAQQVADFIRS